MYHASTRKWLVSVEEIRLVSVEEIQMSEEMVGVSGGNTDEESRSISQIPLLYWPWKEL
jgi:hypothetical protein